MSETVKYEIEFDVETLTIAGVEYMPEQGKAATIHTLSHGLCVLLPIKPKAPPYDWGKMTGWGFAMDANGAVYFHQDPPEMSEEEWYSHGEIVYPEALTTLGIPIPEIHDWKVPLKNPNWKGAN